MKISYILKSQGMFSKDIRIRFKNGQFHLNGTPIKEDIEITSMVLSDVKGEEVTIDDIVEDAGNFIYLNIARDSIWSMQCQIFGFEELFDSNIDNDLTDFLSMFNLLKISKKKFLVIKK